MPGKAQTGSGFSVNRERRTPSASHPAHLCRCPGRWHVVSTERWLLTEQGSEQIGENTINTGVMPMRCLETNGCHSPVVSPHCRCSMWKWNEDQTHSFPLRNHGQGGHRAGSTASCLPVRSGEAGDKE